MYKKKVSALCVFDPLNYSIQSLQFKTSDRHKINMTCFTDFFTPHKTMQELIERIVRIAIQNNYEIGTITGDNNAVVQGSNSNITQQKVEKSTLKEWIEAILQNLVANWLWLGIPIIIATIIGFLSNR